MHHLHRLWLWPLYVIASPPAPPPPFCGLGFCALLPPLHLVNARPDRLGPLLLLLPHFGPEQTPSVGVLIPQTLPLRVLSLTASQALCAHWRCRSVIGLIGKPITWIGRQSTYSTPTGIVCMPVLVRQNTNTHNCTQILHEDWQRMRGARYAACWV